MYRTRAKKLHVLNVPPSILKGPIKKKGGSIHLFYPFFFRISAIWLSCKFVFKNIRNLSVHGGDVYVA